MPPAKTTILCELLSEKKKKKKQTSGAHTLLVASIHLPRCSPITWIEKKRKVPFLPLLPRTLQNRKLSTVLPSSSYPFTFTSEQSRPHSSIRLNKGKWATPLISVTGIPAAGPYPAGEIKDFLSQSQIPCPSQFTPIWQPSGNW